MASTCRGDTRRRDLSIQSDNLNFDYSIMLLGRHAGQAETLVTSSKIQ